MTVVPTNCKESKILYAGDSFFDHMACVIDVIEIINTSTVKVKVYPVHESAIEITMSQYQQYNFVEFIVPFCITPTTIFCSTSKFAKFKVCDLVDADPLQVFDLTLSVPDIVREPLKVKAVVDIKGDGSGNCEIDWAGTKTNHTVSKGTYIFYRTMTQGSHTICAVVT